MRKCARSKVCGCPVLGNVCTTPVSFDLSAKIRSVGTYFTSEYFLSKGHYLSDTLDIHPVHHIIKR